MPKLIRILPAIIFSILFVIISIINFPKIEGILNSVFAIGNPSVTANLSISSDGTPTFDANDNPGNDSSDNNSKVRNNDFITYNVLTSLNESNDSELSVTVLLTDNTVSAIDGAVWVGLPTECKLTNVSTVSSISLDKKTLFCNLGIKNQGTSSIIRPQAKVLGSNINGTIISAEVTVAKTINSNTATTSKVNVTTSASPKVDVSKQFFGAIDMKGSDGTTDGKLLTYSVIMVAKKGSEPLASGNIVLKDEFSLDTARNSNTARLYTWGPNGASGACNYNGNFITMHGEPFGNPSLPVGTPSLDVNGVPIVTDPDLTNSAVNSGNWNCTETTVVNSNVNPHAFDISMTGVDVSLTQPGPTLRANGTIASDTYISSGYIRVWVPLTDYDCGVSPCTKNVLTTNSILPFVANSASGIPNVDPTSPVSSSNTAMYGLYNSKQASGGGGCSTANTFSINMNNTQGTGTGLVFPNDIIQVGVFQYVNQENKLLAQGINCYKTDPTLAELIPINNTERRPTYLSPFTVSEFVGGYNSTNWPNPYKAGINASGTRFYPSLFPPTLEYSTAPIVGDPRTATCANADGPWVTIAPTSGITRVRINHNMHDSQATSPFGYNLASYVNLKIKQKPAGTRVGFFFSNSQDDGMTWAHSSANSTDYTVGSPNYNTYAYNTAFGTVPEACPYKQHGGSDRVTIAAARVSVTKLTCNENVCDDSLNQVKGGDTVKYILGGSIELPSPATAPFSTTTAKLVDVLPVGMTYNSDVTYIDPNVSDGYDPTGLCSGPVISNNTPATGQTTLTWNCSGVEVSGLPDRLPNIKYSATINPTLTSISLTNSVRIESPIDTESVVVANYSNYTKNRTVVISSEGSYVIAKSNVINTIEPNQNMTFNLTYQNNGVYNFAAPIDIIDILPYNGNTHVTPANSFTGTISFDSFTASATGSETIQCTNSTLTSTNPTDSSVTGATWVSCVAGTTYKAIRFRSTVAMNSGSNIRTIKLTLRTNGNMKNDVYTNEFGSIVSLADNTQLLPVISNDSTVTVVAPGLNKKAYDITGLTDPINVTSLTSPRTTNITQNNGKIRNVIDYSYLKGINSSDIITIKDIIQNSQDFVEGSLKFPPILTPDYSIDGGTSFASTEPFSGVNALRLQAKESLSLDNTGVTGSIGLPIGNISTGSGGGDGYIPIIYRSADNSKQYVCEMYHHKNPATINCQSLSTGLPISGYPKNIGTGSFVNLITPGDYQVYFIGDNMYFPAILSGSPQSIGIACYNMFTDSFCGYNMLSNSGISTVTVDNSEYSGFVVDGTRRYLLYKNQLFCYDTAISANCTNATYPVTLAFTYNTYAYLTKSGTNIYASSRNSGFVCVKMSDITPCPGVWPKTNPALGLSPYLNATGVEIGICSNPNAWSPGISPACYDFNGNTLPAPSIINNTALDIRRPTTLGSKIYYAISNISSITNRTYCWDFATNASCAGFRDGGAGAVDGVRRWNQTNQSGIGGNIGNTQDYGYTYDTNTGCMLGLGDSGTLWSFDPLTGNSPCLSQKKEINLKPELYYCDGNVHNITWDKLKIKNPPAGATFKADIKDTYGTIIPGYADRIVVNNEINLSGISYSTYPELKAVLKITTSMAWTSQIDFQLTYVGDNPQICYDTVVSNTCESGTTLGNQTNMATSTYRVSTNASGVGEVNLVTSNQTSLVPYNQVCGKVYVDIDSNLTFNVLTDTLLQNVNLQLQDMSGNPIDVDPYTTGMQSTITTDTFGSYKFSSVPSGTYKIIETQPTGYISMSPINNIMNTSVLTNGMNVNNLDFIEGPLLKISGSVYDEYNSNAPVQGVTITLKDTGGVTIASTNTLVDGTYEFTGIYSGTYTIIEQDPITGYSNGTIETDNIITVVLTTTNSLNNNFGELLKISGVCGNASGKTYAWDATTHGVDTECSIGTLVAGGSVTSWSCNGINNGVMVSCSATLDPEPMCGSASGKTYIYSDSNYGVDTLCNPGSSTPNNPVFPSMGGSVSWICGGVNGGVTKSCQTSRDAAIPTCSGIDMTVQTNSPSSLSQIVGVTTSPTCTFGNLEYELSGSGCSSQGIVSNLTNVVMSNVDSGVCTVTPRCKANAPTVLGSIVNCTVVNITNPDKISGLCGSENLKQYAWDTISYSTSSFCSTGTLSSTPSFPGVGGSINWSCVGANNGVTVSCTASRDLEPMCGSANGKTYGWDSTTHFNLVANSLDSECQIGTLVAGGSVTSWSCISPNGGAVKKCTASLDPEPMCGSASGKTYSEDQLSYGTDTLCNPGSTSSVYFLDGPTGIYPDYGQTSTWYCYSENSLNHKNCQASRSLKTYAISGKVYFDTNGDNLRDSDLVNDATIKIISNGNTIKTLTSKGNYTFDKLLPGTYTIEVTINGIIQVYDMDNTKDNKTEIIVLDHNTTGIDFGYSSGAKISGFVYYDKNRNGLKDNNEVGIQDVLVTIENPSLSNLVLGTLSITTNSSGYYEFTGLVPGNYIIRELHPSKYLDGQESKDDSVITLINDRFENIVLVADGVSILNNFGEYLPKITGRVYLDENKSSTDDVEKPLSGIKIELLDKNNNLITSTITDGNGNYTFVDVLLGDYRIRQIQPEEYDSTENVSNIIDINIVGDVLGNSVNFGEVKKVVLADTGANNIFMYFLNKLGILY